MPICKKKKKLSKKESTRLPKRQQHTRFHHRGDSPLQPTPVADAHYDLITGTINQRTGNKTSSNQTYTSALNTIQKFLTSLRKLPPTTTCEVSSITEEEFTLFLAELKRKKIRSATTYRSALLWEQRRCNANTFADSKVMIKLAKGTLQGSQKSHKGVITRDMLHQLTQWLHNNPTFASKPCYKCRKQFPHLTASHKEYNRSAAKWISFQFLAHVRPGELQPLRKRDLILTRELVGRATFELPSLFYDSRKNEPEGGFYRITKEAQQLFNTLAVGRELDDYIFPSCVDTHIGDIIRRAATQLAWHPDVVWVAHSLRHGALTEASSAIASTVDAFVAQVTSSTLRGTYTKTMKMRTKS
jgi:hypothetical protein